MLLSLLFTHSPLCMCFWINDYEGPYLCLRDWLLHSIFSDSFSHWVKWKRHIILWPNFPLSFVFSGCLVNLSGKLVWSHRALDFHLGIIFHRIWDKIDVIIIFIVVKSYIASMALSPVVQWEGIWSVVILEGSPTTAFTNSEFLYIAQFLRDKLKKLHFNIIIILNWSLQLLC